MRSAEQVLDRAGVLGAVQPMQRHAARIRVRRGGLVERALQPRHEAVHGGLRPGGGTPGGGIMPPRSFRTAFSHTSACSDSCARSIVSNVRSAVFSALVVAGDAVLVEERALRGLRSRGGRGLSAPDRVRRAQLAPTRRQAASTTTSAMVGPQLPGA